MKLSLLLLAPAAVSAFAPTAFTRSSTALNNARVDSADAVAAAMAATKEFGATSKEARVAWDVVEEMDASDNSAATADVSPTFDQYQAKLRLLANAIKEQSANIESVKSLAGELKAIKIVDPEDASDEHHDSAAVSAALSKAMAAAKSASKEFGADSVEARLAWEDVEEIASSDTYQATKPTLEEECLIKTMEACEALEELQNVLDAHGVESD